MSTLFPTTTMGLLIFTISRQKETSRPRPAWIRSIPPTSASLICSGVTASPAKTSEIPLWSKQIPCSAPAGAILPSACREYRTPTWSSRTGERQYPPQGRGHRDPAGFPRCPFLATGIDDMENRVCLSQIVEELVAEAASLMRIGNETRDVDHVDRDKTVPLVA